MATRKKVSQVISSLLAFELLTCSLSSLDIYAEEIGWNGDQFYSYEDGMPVSGFQVIDGET